MIFRYWNWLFICKHLKFNVSVWNGCFSIWIAAACWQHCGLSIVVSISSPNQINKITSQFPILHNLTTTWTRTRTRSSTEKLHTFMYLHCGLQRKFHHCKWVFDNGISITISAVSERKKSLPEYGFIKMNIL